MSSATSTEPADGGLLLRPAIPEDAVAVADLYTAVRRAAVPLMPPAVHDNAEDRAFYAARLADGEHEAWLAEQDGVLLGFTLLTDTWLDALYVHPDAQRRGVGSALLELAQALRPGGLGLWVFETNAPARALYRRAGFTEVERTDGSGNEEGAPDVRMEWPGVAASAGG